MLNSRSDNKRIAKNILLLYARMIYSLVISLYTSGVILQALGFQDYGLYNVIGSVVSMFVFLRSAMGNSVSYFITFAIGKGDKENINKIFSMSLMIHTTLAVIIIIICETIGVWFLNTQMEIPEGREIAANWVLQFSILACALSVICVPYDAEIIAHEKMGVFAFIQVLNSTLTLIIAFIIRYYDEDRLILYALLLLIIQIMNRLIYGIYCGKKFPETKFKWINDKKLFQEMTAFAGWSLIGNVAYIGYTQGINLLLNVFFGPVVNAARAIAFNVQGAIKGFVTNFQMAVNPQITKSYAQGDHKRLHLLVFFSSKLSYFLLYSIVLPIAIESKEILYLWLGEVPDYTLIFTILTLAIMLIDPLSNPLGVANNATGKIRNYQIVEGGFLLLILPVAYTILKLGGDPISVFIVQLVVLYMVQIFRVFLVCHKVSISKKEYFIEILLRVVVVSVLSAILPILLFLLLPKEIVSVISIVLTSFFSVLFFSYFFGLNELEKTMVNSKIIELKRKLIKKS